MRNSLAYLRGALLVAGAFVVVDRGPVLVAASDVPICDEVCTGSTECGTLCYENMMEFENGNDITCYEYDVYDPDQFCCLDRVCNLGAEESCGNCTADCGTCLSPQPVCGLYGCEQGENCRNCATDCGGCGSSGQCDYDGRCESGEDEYCQDCQFTGFCSTTSECPNFQGGILKYVCVNDRCVIEDLPFVTNTCETDLDCPTEGWKCKKVEAGYQGSTFTCPESAPNCKVCVPPWAS